ncbi:MAG: FKBP-type peptidyl-prolyl cis-trans isomerase [Opitutales bacterium]|nr:FKBP-type peptidyl-prolyl cis-trans isomerase [Opitutales bacterium]
MSIGRYLRTGLGVSFAVFSLGAYAQDPDQAVTAGGESDAAAVKPVEVSDREAMNTLGFLVAKKMKLDVGFTKQEMDWILEGVVQGSDPDAKASDNFQLVMQRAEAIYMGHVNAAMLSREKEAEQNAASALDYVKSIEQSEGLLSSISGLYYKIVEEGNQEKMAAPTDRVKVSYEGRLIDGTVFDKSEEPVEFAVNGVVPGFGEGLQIIGEGGKIRLYIPSRLGYGINPPPGSSIRPGDMLIFDVELVEVTHVATRAKAKPVIRPGMGVPGAPPNVTPPPPPNMKVPPMPKTPPPSTPPPPLPDEAFEGKSVKDSE